MKLWILEPHEPRPDPWRQWDVALGFVVRAETEADARALADRSAGDENWENRHPWLDPQLASCKELTPEGPPEVVICDFKAG